MVSVYLNGRVVPCHSAWLWVSFMTGTFCSVMLLQCAATKSHLGEQKDLRCSFQLILTQHKPIMYGQRNEFCTIHWLTQFMVLSNTSIYGLTSSRDCTCYLCVIRCQLSFGSGLHERVICLSLISRSMCVHEHVLWTQEHTLYKPPRAPTPLHKATPPNPQSMCSACWHSNSSLCVILLLSFNFSVVCCQLPHCIEDTPSLLLAFADGNLEMHYLNNSYSPRDSDFKLFEVYLDSLFSS